MRSLAFYSFNFLYLTKKKGISGLFGRPSHPFVCKFIWYIIKCKHFSFCGMIALPTFDSAMTQIEAMVRITATTRLRAPITRVPVFKEANAQQFDNFGRVAMVKLI